ncbi:MULTISPECIES: NUDIX hydrolase [unclassified Pseudomonas]|uniref:NUDIX hydrolase n=1 Tax=unclassified Pseudomonas TaxID=196821 RepID=UPI0011EE6E49|nr:MULTISPECIES: NUDIX hydrolase [unclassified Pseudomonas]KAA0946945.1 NUDIX hydrolase [Pseudomonas sp. ANT_H4]KAA0953487.1 NUDIX hydrolase [Pseudomonas sp. ANT_H14]
MAAPRIRALALCIFHRNGQILVHQFYDSTKHHHLYRPIGGGIEFGETSAEAIVREVQEELEQPIHSLRLLGTLESIFIYAGNPGHEIVQVYDGQFEDQRLYELPHIDGEESNGAAFKVSWQDSSSFSADSPLVPEGLYDLLKGAGLLK